MESSCGIGWMVGQYVTCSLCHMQVRVCQTPFGSPGGTYVAELYQLIVGEVQCSRCQIQLHCQAGASGGL